MNTSLPASYRVSHTIPSVATYRRLRQSSPNTISAKSIPAASAGLPNSLFSVQIICDIPSSTPPSNSEFDPSVVGMGRIVGDGGCFFQIVDIVVLPAHQGRGLGKLIMSEVVQWMEENVPETAYVSLMADGRATELYRQFGFRETAAGGTVAFKNVVFAEPSEGAAVAEWRKDEESHASFAATVDPILLYAK